MNTLRDTDGGRARPSVWPVYVWAVVVLIVGLQNLFFPDVTLAQLALGLFGVVTAIGMLRLRRWGWWCGIVFTGVWIVQLGTHQLRVILAVPPTPPDSITIFLAACLVPAFLILWLLATRRQLFFPPKQEGEE